MKKIITRTNAIEVDSQKVRFVLHFADAATPESAGGPGSLHVDCKFGEGLTHHAFFAADDPLAKRFAKLADEALAALSE
jgi:hypothetical protein